jgi:hypothetical protein
LEVTVKEIPVSGGLVALVDDEDEALVSGYKWYKLIAKRSNTVYAVANSTGVHPRKHILMHRLILAAPCGVKVDHQNLNGLDCQRQNLRLATNSQNNFNAGKRLSYGGVATSSQYKGVYWHQSRSKWEARAVIGGRLKHLGQFMSENDAALAYNAAAAEQYGEFARLNTMVTARQARFEHGETPRASTRRGA